MIDFIWLAAINSIVPLANPKESAMQENNPYDKMVSEAQEKLCAKDSRTDALGQAVDLLAAEARRLTRENTALRQDNASLTAANRSILNANETLLAQLAAPIPETKTLRDEFAVAAITGMLARNVSQKNMLSVAEDAYVYADAMLFTRVVKPQE